MFIGNPGPGRETEMLFELTQESNSKIDDLEMSKVENPIP